MTLGALLMNQHDEFARFAAEYAGSELDLDPLFESAGIDHLISQEALAVELCRHHERNPELRVKFEQKETNLEESRPVEFYFCARSQRDAAVLGRSLYQLGFLIRQIAPAATDDDPERWLVEAGARISLHQALGDELAKKLIDLAAAEDATFDGWGTSI